MYCPQCQHLNDAKNRFCPNCGENFQIAKEGISGKGSATATVQTKEVYRLENAISGVLDNVTEPWLNMPDHTGFMTTPLIADCHDWRIALCRQDGSKLRKYCVVASIKTQSSLIFDIDQFLEFSESTTDWSLRFTLRLEDGGLRQLEVYLKSGNVRDSGDPDLAQRWYSPVIDAVRVSPANCEFTGEVTEHGSIFFGRWLKNLQIESYGLKLRFWRRTPIADNEINISVSKNGCYTHFYTRGTKARVC